jgi:hypothetical protein
VRGAVFPSDLASLGVFGEYFVFGHDFAWMAHRLRVWLGLELGLNWANVVWASVKIADCSAKAPSQD